jgi:protein SCO1
MRRNNFAVLILFVSIVANAQNALPPQLQEVKLEQNLNQQVPLDLRFKDETGKNVQLGDLLEGKPSIVNLAYFDCPMLCSQVAIGLITSLRPVNFSVGKEFNVLTISFDPKDTPDLAAAKKYSYLKDYNRSGAEKGWHFLTGSQKSIEQLTKAIGFKYVYDPKIDQFAHASGIIVLTPEGRISRYFYGIEYASRDLRLALVEASQNKIGNIADEVLLFCFHYDPTTGKYSAAAINFIRLGAIITVLMLGGFIIKMRRKEKSDHV